MMETVLTILEWLGWTLVALGGLTLFILNMPYVLRAAVELDNERTYATAYLGWPWNLVGLRAHVSLDRRTYRFLLFGLSIKSGPLSAFPGKKESAKKEEKKRSKTTLAQLIHWLKTPYLSHFLSRVFRWLFFKSALCARVGLGDPALTGQLAVWFIVMRSIVPGFADNIDFDFNRAVVEGRARLSMTVWLPRLLWGAGIYLLSARGRAIVRHYFARPRPARETT